MGNLGLSLSQIVAMTPDTSTCSGRGAASGHTLPLAPNHPRGSRLPALGAGPHRIGVVDSSPRGGCGPAEPLELRIHEHLTPLWTGGGVDEELCHGEALRAYIERFSGIRGCVHRGAVSIDLHGTTLIEGSMRHEGSSGRGRMPDILVDLSRDELARRALVEPLLPLRSSTGTLLERVGAARGAVSRAFPRSGVGYYPDVLDFDALLSHEDTLLEPYRSFIDSLHARRVALVCLGELIRLGSGDCRAYAVAMEIALKSAGVADTCLAYFTELTPEGVSLGDHMLSLVYYPGDPSTDAGVYILDAMPESSPFWNARPLAPLVSLSAERSAVWLDRLPERIARALSAAPQLERSPDAIAGWTDLVGALGHRRVSPQGMRLRPNLYPIIVCEATTPELQVTDKEGPHGPIG